MNLSITILIAGVSRTIKEDISNRRKALSIILGFSIIRCLIAFSMELGTDEAYYWLYSQDIKWNYYDHPPIVAVWIRLFTANLLLQDVEGFVRLGSIVGGAIASWAIYKTGETIHSSKAGLYGVWLYQASVYTTVTAGIFIMPDTPQMVFYTLALWMMARITKDGNNWMTWIAFGMAAGLCIMSKIYGVFIWIGLGLFVLLKKREWFSQPYIYAAFLITAIIASPILIWNIQNDFLTYQFHSNRVTVKDNGADMILFGREIINQVLYNNPVNVLVSMAALTAFIKQRKKETSADTLTIYIFIALPLALLLLAVSLFRDTTLPHWSGPAYIALIPMTAIYLADRTARYAKRILVTAVSTLVAFLLVWQYLIHFAPVMLGERDAEKRSRQPGRETVKRLYSGFESFQLIAETKNTWEPAGKTFYNLYLQETNNGLMEKNAPVICYKWWGAHIEYYFCHPYKIPMIGLGRPDELHEYLFTNAQRMGQVNMNTAYCLVPADDNYNVRAMYSSYYQQIESPSLITVKRTGKPTATFYVYRLRGWKNQIPIIDKR